MILRIAVLEFPDCSPTPNTGTATAIATQRNLRGLQAVHGTSDLASASLKNRQHVDNVTEAFVSTFVSRSTTTSAIIPATKLSPSVP